MADFDFRVLTAQYDQSVRRINQQATQNATSFGYQVADAFSSEAKKRAPWTDRKGVARRGIFGNVSGSGTVIVTMGASAPNYKRGPKSSADYMEYLEFAHGRRFAVVEPIFNGIVANVREQFPNAVVHGVRFKLNRDRERARLRAAKSRARTRMTLEMIRRERAEMQSKGKT